MLRQITRDHSLVQELLEAGAIGPDEAVNHPRGNVITRAVGAEIDEFLLDKVSDRLLPGDRFLLCSDGLCKTLPESELASLLAAIDGTPPQAVIDAALALDASDNVTAVMVEFDSAEVRPADCRRQAGPWRQLPRMTAVGHQRASDVAALAG